MADEKPQQFSSRLGLILTTIGAAVGTGNIWRFPREAAANGGGSFMIGWLLFLFAWSIIWNLDLFKKFGVSFLGFSISAGSLPPTYWLIHRKKQEFSCLTIFLIL